LKLALWTALTLWYHSYLSRFAESFSWTELEFTGINIPTTSLNCSSWVGKSKRKFVVVRQQTTNNLPFTPWHTKVAVVMNRSRIAFIVDT
jgi:hypothetical protein